MSEIISNIKKVKSAMKRAAERAGRNPEEVKLIAVTKTIGRDKVEEAINAGLTLFGENRIQEAQKKKPLFLLTFNGI